MAIIWFLDGPFTQNNLWGGNLNDFHLSWMHFESLIPILLKFNLFSIRRAFTWRHYRIKAISPQWTEFHLWTDIFSIPLWFQMCALPEIRTNPVNKCSSYEGEISRFEIDMNSISNLAFANSSVTVSPRSSFSLFISMYLRFSPHFACPLSVSLRLWWLFLFVLVSPRHILFFFVFPCLHLPRMPFLLPLSLYLFFLFLSSLVFPFLFLSLPVFIFSCSSVSICLSSRLPDCPCFFLSLFVFFRLYSTQVISRLPSPSYLHLAPIVSSCFSLAPPVFSFLFLLFHSLRVFSFLFLSLPEFPCLYVCLLSNVDDMRGT